MPLIPEDLRVDYAKGSLNEADVSADPFSLFSQWFGDATRAGIPQPNAMTLATADASGKPSARIVLLKAFDDRGFCFFTNYNSQKGRELAENPNAALVLFWEPQERQVRVEGRVEQVSRQESEAYFRVRPREAQIGAWASDQSSVIASRKVIEQREQELIARFAGQDVPLPDFWGGYRIVPHTIEFWQGRPGRLHDRIVYRRLDAAGSAWTLLRLSP